MYGNVGRHRESNALRFRTKERQEGRLGFRYMGDCRHRQEAAAILARYRGRLLDPVDPFHSLDRGLSRAGPAELRQGHFRHTVVHGLRELPSLQ